MTNSHTIKIYSTPSCPYCVMAKEFFTKKGIQYTDVNVASNVEAAKEMVQKSGQMGVPVVEIDGKIIVGFQPDLFDQLTQ